jgi:predicted transcriptional regulator
MTAGKVKLTIYVSQEIAKALWHARAETRKPISHIIEEAVSSFLTPKK